MTLQTEAHTLVPIVDGDALHRIVVFGVPDDPHELRDLLVRRLGRRTDAQIHVHALPGLLPDRLSTQPAAELATAIRELGVNAMAIPDDEVPSLNALQTVHHVRCTESGLDIVDMRGETESVVAWDDIQLLSIGAVPLDVPHHVEPRRMVVVTATPHRRTEDSDLTPVNGPEALIVASNPFRVLRIDHGRMNYEYLKDRIDPSSSRNFRILIQDVVNAAVDVDLTPATKAFLERGLFRHYQFRSRDELGRYTLFHLLVRDSRIRSTPHDPTLPQSVSTTDSLRSRLPTPDTSGVDHAGLSCHPEYQFVTRQK